MILFQWLLILLFITILIKSFLLVQHRKINYLNYIIITSIFLIGILFTIFPKIVILISSILGLKRGVDIIFYSSIFILFLISFKLYLITEKQRIEITKLTREIAILKKRLK